MNIEPNTTMNIIVLVSALSCGCTVTALLGIELLPQLINLRSVGISIQGKLVDKTVNNNE